MRERAAFIRENLLSGRLDVLAQGVNPKEVTMLSFEEALGVSVAAVENEWGARSVMRFGVDTLDALRLAHPERWAADWRHEMALARGCDELFLFDQRNAAYERATMRSTTAVRVWPGCTSSWARRSARSSGALGRMSCTRRGCGLDGCDRWRLCG